MEIVVDELRRARQAQGVSQESLAEKAGVSQSLVAQVESGRRPPTVDFLGRCDEALSTGGLLSRLRDQLAKWASLPQGFRPWIGIESTARALRTYHSVLVPGLLQTPGYALAVLGSEELMVARMGRQAILAALDSFVVVIDESVVHRPIGGPEVMAEQLARLAEEPCAAVHVVPSSAGHYHGLEGAFTVATLEDATEVCLMEDLAGGRVSETPGDIARARLAWETVRSEALSRRQSEQLLREVSERWGSSSASRVVPGAVAEIASR